ncbi:MAG TPA: TadE/TadG family type IV pilus assembly protein [Terracidiphilus sp.]|nr:TadE/TadG family type IV pilus assembly protein [Terracidiphilus sp.]
MRWRARVRRLARRANARKRGAWWRWAQGQDGASLVEVAVSLAVYLSLLFSVIEISLALYAYNFVSDAAREATRYAVIRGANSCVPSPGFPNCNLQPGSITSTTNPSANPVLAYIDSLRYPGLDPNNLSTDVTWWVASQNASGVTSWTVQCTGRVDVKGNACNAEGNAVKVVVTYQFPLSVPWLRPTIAHVSSTSQMVINF